MREILECDEEICSACHVRDDRVEAFPELLGPAPCLGHRERQEGVHCGILSRMQPLLVVRNIAGDLRCHAAVRHRRPISFQENVKCVLACRPLGVFQDEIRIWAYRDRGLSLPCVG